MYKEVHVNKPANEWREISLNTGGVPSTLQDVKSHHRSGGYVYKRNSNRFIYWRTKQDTLELIEESLDATLRGNCLRFKFTDSPVVEGISITEILNRVIILVPTLSSLHRFTFTHPEKLNVQGLSEGCVPSIFHSVSEADCVDPRTYHVIDSLPSTVVAGASCLAYNNDAVFVLSLANSTLLLFNMEPLSGSVTTRMLAQESIMPKFLSGFTVAFLGKEHSGNVGVSVALHYFNKDLYLFSLEQDGKIRVLNCGTGSHVTTFNLLSGRDQNLLKGQKHKLVKAATKEGDLVLCACLQGSWISVIRPSLYAGMFTFNNLCHMPTPMGLDLVDMTAGAWGDLWCIWLTGEEIPTVTRIRISTLEWADVSLARPSFEVTPSKFIATDPATLYLDAIFTSGYFTAGEVAKALSVSSIYKSNSLMNSNLDIRDQIYALVEAEIFSEVGEQELDDDEFLEISTRCWCRLYSCCSQFVMTGMLPLGLLWLPASDCILLIKENSFSLVRDMHAMEILASTNLKPNSFPFIPPYAELLDVIRGVDFNLGIEQLDLALHLGDLLENHIEEAVKAIPLTEKLTMALGTFKRESEEDSLRALFEELMEPQEFMNPGPDGESFCSGSGISAVCYVFRDLALMKLRLCQKVLLILKMNQDFGNYGSMCMNLCTAYYLLHWTCTTNITVDVPIIHSFAAAHKAVAMQPTLFASVSSLFNLLWPKEDNESLAQHLFSSKAYHHLQTLARIVNNCQWKMLLAESFLQTGEWGKAYDITLEGNSVSHFLKVVRLFERYERLDLAVSIASHAMNCNPTKSELETLHSLLFVHELQLKHYEAAYSWVESCPNWSRRSDSLHRLISAMLLDGRLEEILSFPYTNLLDELEQFLYSRARSLNFANAITYYNLLYGLHVKHENFKRAASVMFEKGLRSDSCELQWRCLVICLNSLMLVEPEQAWLLRPTASQDPDEDSIEVLDVNEIRREFELAGARYNLGDCSPDATVDEVIGMCIGRQQYRTAFRIAKMWDISCVPVIEAFTASCANLTDNFNSWQWLKHNEVDNTMVSEKNAKEMCWRFLDTYIMKYENDDHQTVLHKAAANKLMEMGCFLPAWLVSSYQKRNAAELLRLYLKHGELEHASSMAVSFLKAGLGIGKEEFGMDSFLLPTSYPIWLPLNTIDLLLRELHARNIADELQSTLDQYLQTAIRMSNDKLQAIKV